MKSDKLFYSNFFFNTGISILVFLFILMPVFSPSALCKEIMNSGDIKAVSSDRQNDDTNPVQDGGFEKGISGIWDDNSLLFEQSIYQNEEAAHSGEWLVWFAGGDDYEGAENASVAQSVTIPKAGKATLTFWFQILWADVTGVFKVKIDEQELFIATDAGEYDEWTEIKIDISPFADGNSHYLKIEANILEGEGSTDFLLDDVSVTAESVNSPLTGDADGNGKVDIFDALIIAEFDANIKRADQVPGLALADVDKSGKVDIYDALGIAKFDARLILSFDELIQPDDNPVFAVFSDPHYFDPDLLISDGEAFQNYLAFDRKLLRESGAILDATISSITENKEIDFVIVSGDLTKDGELTGHQKFAAYLKILENKGIQVYVIPGNHDINNPHAMSFDGETAIPVDTVTPEEFAQIYAEYGYNQAIYRDSESLSYIAEPAPGFWLFALDSCQYDENKTLGKPVTAGRFSEETLNWILERLAQAKTEGKKVIGMMHHGILEHFTGQSKVNPGKEYVIEDWQTISESFAKSGLHIVFTGHYHAQDITSGAWETDDGTVSLTDVETGSLVTFPNPYRIVTLGEDNTADIQSSFITQIDYNTGLMTFPEYSEAFIEQGIYGLAYYSLTLPLAQGGFGLSENDANLIAPSVSNAFKAHYTGDETPTPETLAAIMTYLQSTDPVIRQLGQILYSLWTDLLPADNKITINLK